VFHFLMTVKFSRYLLMSCAQPMKRRLVIADLLWHNAHMICVFRISHLVSQLRGVFLFCHGSRVLGSRVLGFICAWYLVFGSHVFGIWAHEYWAHEYLVFGSHGIWYRSMN